MVDRKLSLPMVFYFLVVHLLGVVGVVYAYYYASAVIVWVAVIYFFACHLSITVMAHRYTAHKAFGLNQVVQLVLVLLFCGTAQSSLIIWASRHLEHHGNEDVPGLDPHTPLDGFWYSHMGCWLYESGYKMHPKYSRHFETEKSQREMPWVHWQHRHYILLMLVMAFVVPTIIGGLLGDWLGGLLVIGFARLIFQYHLTWMVNSVGHSPVFGHSVESASRAVNFGVQFFFMPIAAVLTVGEAYHGNHHYVPGHWRLGRKWWQVDPGAYLVWILYQLGLAWDLRTPPPRRKRASQVA